MKKRLISLAAVTLSSCLVAGIAIAHHASTHSAKTTTKTEVLLRTKPSATSKILAHIPLNSPLVGFYKKGAWIKAGDPKTGQVGWYNSAQVAEAFAAKASATKPVKLKQPVLHEMYISASKDGNAPAKVVVYKNGKKLDAKQAKAVYQKTEKQMQQEQSMWQSSLQRQLQQMSGMIHQMQAETWASMPVQPLEAKTPATKTAK